MLATRLLFLYYASLQGAKAFHPSGWRGATVWGAAKGVLRQPNEEQHQADSCYTSLGSYGRLGLVQNDCTRKIVCLYMSESFDDNIDDAADDDEDEAPLAKGVDSVDWLPSVQSSMDNIATSKPETVSNGAEILPLFPLGGIVYTPNSEHILNIFEPRYRQMYSDILMNGSKRFVVSMVHPAEPGRFASMGVLFELEDLKEVSEQTGDQIKFICNHKVTRRVKIQRVLNPDAWASRETYLKTEAVILPEDDDSDEDPINEKRLTESFSDMVDIQHDLEEDVRFTKSATTTLAIKPGAGENGLWQTIKLWQSFVDQRLMARQNELQRDFQEKLQSYLKREKGLKQNELPSAIGFQDLPQELQQEVVQLQKRMAVELQPLVLESQLTMQKILECGTHTDRLKLVRSFVESETARLRAKKAFQGMIAGETSQIPPEEQLEDDASSSTTNQSFFSEDDAFQ